MIAELFTVVAPVFIATAAGYAWARLKIEFHPEFVSRLVVNIGSPCLVFDGLTHLRSAAALFGTMLLAAMIMLTGLGLLNVALLKALGKPMRSYAHALTFPNWGNLGLPLGLFAFGPEGLGLTLGFFIVSSVVQNTLGLMFMAGTTHPRELARMPMIYAVILALLFMASHTAPPKWLADTANLLGGMMIPLMLISLGASLATLHHDHLKEVAPYVLWRLVVGIGLGFLIAWALGLHGMARGVVILTSGMPVATLNYLFAARYRQSPEAVASIVFLSNLASFVVIPVLLWVLL